MVKNQLVTSNGDAKRMIKQGAVKLNNKKVSDIFILVVSSFLDNRNPCL